MLNFIVKRMLLMVPTLFAIVLIVFVMVNIAPGTPGQAQSASGSESVEDSANARESYRLFKQQYQLDKPIIINTRWRLGPAQVVENLETLADASLNLTAPEQLARHVAEQSARFYERRLAEPRIALEAQLQDATLEDSARAEIQQTLQALPPARVDTPRAPRPPQGRVMRAENQLEDWGHDIVPELVQIATRYVALRDDNRTASYTFLAREDAAWENLRAGKTLSIDGANQRLDYARTFKVRHLAIQRLSVNARRDITLDDGGAVSAEQREQNRAIVRENEALSFWTYPLDAPTDTREAIEIQWVEWFNTNAEARYQRSFGRSVSQTFFDTRFAHYMGNLMPFSFKPTPHFRAPKLGMSMRYRRPVLEVIGEHWRYSIGLSLISLLLAYCIAVPIGVLAAVRHNGPIADRGVGILLFILYSFPVFLGATLLQTWLTPARGFDWFPVSGFDDGRMLSHTALGYIWVVTKHLALPVICLTYPSLAALSRYARSGLLDVIRADYIRTARAKGLPEWIVITRHTVRNGMIPIITLLGSTLPAVIGGSIVIEYIFAIEGMGALMLQSIGQRDYNVILGVLLISSVLTLIGILLSDIAYALVDPRISYD